MVVEDTGDYFTLKEQDGEKVIEIQYSSEIAYHKEKIVEKVFEGCKDNVYIELDGKTYVCAE